ncbi:hypothetical protein HYFRA_00000335 [Hymenoscyphus fraxineus]|uniref:Uncharacterized protein n=1 Tax=Hymenoscyphus fraxineus TaxID=746836 RepID=A0A9N9L5N7_9HELO|nr:hypothetical protein HYFRA_00000335 [Hymenoscyphus fraxineus]
MNDQQPSGTWRYNSVLGEMEDAIIRLEDDEQAPDPRLKSTIRAEHLTPLAFYRFYYRQLNQVQTAHPFASIHMTKYLTERRLWENYFDKTQHPFIGQTPLPGIEVPVQQPSPSTSHQSTITLTITEYNRIIRQQFDDGKREGMRIQRQMMTSEYLELQRDMTGLVLQTRAMTDEVLRESRRF